MTPENLRKIKNEAIRQGYDPKKLSMNPGGPGASIIRKIANELGISMGKTVKRKDGGLMEAIRKVDAEKKFKDGKTVEADPTFEAMIKRNGKKTEKTKSIPPISKEARVKRKDPNIRPRKFSDYIQRSGDSPLVALIASSLAKTGLMDKKDKVTHPMEVKKFSQGASVEAEMNRGNTTKNFKGSF